jgi:hypothetical protein
MQLAAFFLLAGAAGAYFTSIGCRRAHAKNLPPSWRYAWFATLGTVLLSVLLVCQGDLFHPRRWDTAKGSIWSEVVMVSCATAVPAMLASVIVLEVFWRKFKA